MESFKTLKKIEHHVECLSKRTIKSMRINSSTLRYGEHKNFRLLFFHRLYLCSLFCILFLLYSEYIHSRHSSIKHFAFCFKQTPSYIKGCYDSETSHYSIPSGVNSESTKLGSILLLLILAVHCACLMNRNLA